MSTRKKNRNRYSGSFRCAQRRTFFNYFAAFSANSMVTRSS